MLLIAILAADVKADPATVREQFRTLQPGDTLILGDGVYREGLVVPPTAWGSEGRPTVVRAERPWGPIVLSGPDGLGVTIGRGAHDVSLAGVRVHGALADGIWARECTRVSIIDCRVEHCARNGVTLFGDDCRLEGNVIRFNGLDSYHHGVYFFGRRNVIARNVVACNAGYGLHGFHEGDPSAVVDTLIFGNLVFGHGLPAFSSDSNPGKAGILIETGGGNMVVANWAVHNYVDLAIRSQGNTVFGNVTGRSATTRPWRDDFRPWPAASRPAEN